MDKKFTLLLLSIFICLSSIGQITSNKAHPLYKIDKELKLGNKTALYEIAPYFDSKKELEEKFAYNHISARNESEVAKRIVKVNSIFTNTEIIIEENTSSQDFLKFLNANIENITYSKYANAFLITPLETRFVNIRFREITEVKRLKLKDEYQGIFSSLANQEIKSLIESKDPKSLFIITSELFKERNWLNTFGDGSKKDEYIKLLQLLTNVEIEVEGDYNKMTWHIDEEYYPIAALNLLCYLSANYPKFKWNENKKIFENNDIKIFAIGKENSLFQLLGSENDSIALSAFIQLTTCNPAKVTELANEYLRADFDHNYVLPTFPYKFLKQLVALTNYCDINNIDFAGTKELQKHIMLLRSDLSFSERRKLEDTLIKIFTLDDITAFEYWALIYEQSWGLTYSAGRMLDIFYSNHFSEILNNNKQLNLYLKKSSIFDNLGIIGVCNNYLKKFTYLKEYGVERLNTLQTTDAEINTEIEKANIICYQPIKIFNDTMKVNIANKDFVVNNLRQNIIAIKKIKDQEKLEDSLTELLSKINYNQIGEAMKEIEDIKFKESEWKKYSFLERDFGFFIYDNFDTITGRNEFLADYEKFSEFNFYKNMLIKAESNYFYDDNTLNYDKIFDALKYNVVVAFVGGGGGRQDNEVYSIIKLLELTHKTTLGYPKKLCNSNGIYGCDSQDRANYWLQYLTDNKILKLPHNEPISFHYE